MVAKDRTMCLSTAALALFLNLLPPDIIETGPDTVTVHATARDAIWQVQGDRWCTDRPRITQAAGGR